MNIRPFRSVYFVAVLFISVTLISFAGPSSRQGSDDEFAYAHLRNRLLQLEKQLTDISQNSSLSSARRVEMADKIQAELAGIKKKLEGHFPPADIAISDAIDSIQTHGDAWFLRYLTHGRFTGRKSEHHKPLEAVEIPSKKAELAGKAALPFLGYPLMVILSYDAVSREAYREFIPQMESIVREMEKRSGKPCEFWDPHPTIIANDLGWDVDLFWSFAQECAGRAVKKYFWRATPTEVRRATDLVALIICTSFLNNVSIDLDGDKETQSKKTFWRANAAPWFNPDKSTLRNKFHVFHFFTHAWLVYLKMFNDTRFDDRILSEREAKPPTRWMLKNAFWFSNVTGFGYEGISTVAGTKHGFLETTAVQALPRPLMKVAQTLHLKNIIMYESVRDLADNREGAWFGAALFLKGNETKLSAIPEHRRLVEEWQNSLKDGGSPVEPETGGPQAGQGEMIGRDRVSVYDLNSPEGKKRIDSGFFNEVYRGAGSFDAAAHAEAEKQAFRNLLGEDILSYNLRKLYGTFQSAMDNPAKAYLKAKASHAAMIKSQFEETDQKTREDIFRDLFSNDSQRPQGDDYNHEADYIYATHRADIAGCYGPIVLTIRENTPRGLDLNQIADTYKYYSKLRFLKNALRLRWQTMLGDYVLDKDEYLIPSFVPASEIIGFVARSPNAKVVRKHIAAADKDFVIALKAPPILRRYAKQMIGGYLVIDVFDGQNRLIKRLSESPDHTPFTDKIQNSSETIPPAIQALWDEHLQTRKTN